MWISEGGWEDDLPVLKLWGSSESDVNSLASGRVSLIKKHRFSSVLLNTATSCAWGRHLAALQVQAEAYSRNCCLPKQRGQKTNRPAGMLVLVCSLPFSFLCNGRDNGPPPSLLYAGSRDNVGLGVKLMQSQPQTMFV